MSESHIIVDPAGAYVSVDGTFYYRDGVLYGHELPSDPVKECPMPTLWSHLVIKYRKKPVEVEAIQLRPENAEAVASWCGGMVVEEAGPTEEHGWMIAVQIPTLEGVMTANDGDYVIKGLRGEFYPCKPDIFSESYDVV